MDSFIERYIEEATDREEMNRKSDVEIFRNLFETAIDKIPEIYKQVKTLRIPFEEVCSDTYIQALTSGKIQITQNWRQAEELMFLIEDCRELAEKVNKTFHPNTDSLLTQIYQILKDELSEHRKEEFPMKKVIHKKEVMRLLDELNKLHLWLSTLPRYKKSRRLGFRELSINPILKTMIRMLKNENTFQSLDANTLLQLSHELESISITRRNKKLAFPIKATELFRNTKSKVTKALNACPYAKRQLIDSQLEEEYRPLPVSDLSTLKGEFWETFAHLKGVAEKIMNFPK